MSAKEILDIISKIWCNTEDLMKLSGLGYVKASYLKKEIREDMLSKGIYLPKGKVPMPEVVKKLNIDVEHYKKIAEYQLKEKMVKTML